MKYINYYRQMRIILFYDLPMINDNDRVVYNKFHNSIKKLGFYMIQYSVYTKVIQNEFSFIQRCDQIKKIIPDRGSIVILRVTEKQYQNIIYLKGDKNKFDVIVGGNELVYFGGDSYSKFNIEK